MGNLRTALLAWLFAHAGGGQFVLRVEDLDQPRVRPGAARRMLDDLQWLGLDWDEGPGCGGPYAPYIQSERIAIYQDYLQRLRAADLVYPCYCSRAEIAQAARIASTPQQGAQEGPRYPSTAAPSRGSSAPHTRSPDAVLRCASALPMSVLSHSTTS